MKPYAMTYNELDRVFDALEQNAINTHYAADHTLFVFSDGSYAYAYYGYEYTSITIYSHTSNIIAYFYNQQENN